MGGKDALRLLYNKVPFSKTEREDAKSPVEALDRNALAIVQAGAYISIRSPVMTISTYLSHFRESDANQLRLLDNADRKDNRRENQHTVMATLYITFDHMERIKPYAIDLLALMCMFDKQGIPKWLIQENEDPLNCEDDMAHLLNLSLVRSEIGGQMFGMHRLVQFSMRMWQKKNDELSEWVTRS